MTSTPRAKFSTTLNYGGRVRLLAGRLHRSRWPGGGYYGTGDEWRTESCFRVASDQWFPIGTVLVCDTREDVDKFRVNVEQTMLECGFTQEWLDEHEPGRDSGAQLMLL